ncbi:alpha/beta hydrolase [Streptomyces kaniharaensis]|uniref:Alpha/beta hydrolase n=1 Tax=Streptomyces kaniharaensis TaxID=212423 RepID=A0A6N7KLM6_9ACTN|nr:alpha/beta hydrolase [Streptomyces kaniharaensis]MQS11675.1 alpha/beta hydrolase [Streptomyces kaniharaensis]
MIPRFRRHALPALAAALAVALPAGCTGPSGPGAGRAGAGEASRPPLSERVSATAAPALRALYDQRIPWKPCADDVNADPNGPVVQCATLKVPLDYTDPGGETIDVALARMPAADPGRRIGSLLLNPGGPGNSGVDMVRWGWRSYQGPLHDRFDLVGFDPRGAGRTTPVACLDDRTRDEWTSTDDPAYDHGRILADACRAKDARMLPYLGTRNTARDLDVLRGALGDRKLDFLGLSYGTYLGALYAEEFPDRTGRLVLDGAVERGTDLVHLNAEQAAATETAFRAFAADCATAEDSCPLGTDPAAAPQRLADFLDGLDERPLRADRGRLLTATLGWNATLNVLYDGHRSWERLRTALEPALTRRDADDLLKLADSANGRDEQGHFDTSADAYTAIHCADAPLAPTEAELSSALADLADRAPLVGRHDTRAVLLDPDCRSWPFRSPEHPHTVKAPGSAPILVVGSTGDPVTPYVWAQRMAAGLEHGVLLTRDGDGHTAYDKSGCVRAAVTAFLVDGRLPGAGTRCPSD